MAFQSPARHHRPFLAEVAKDLIYFKDARGIYSLMYHRGLNLQSEQSSYSRKEESYQNFNFIHYFRTQTILFIFLLIQQNIDQCMDLVRDSGMRVMIGNTIAWYVRMGNETK